VSAVLSRQLQCGLRELMADMLALLSGVDSDRSKQRTLGVDLQCGTADDLRVLPCDEHRLHVIVHAIEWQPIAHEKFVHVGQIASCGGFDGQDHTLYARGAQQLPPAGVSSTYSCPNDRWNCLRSCVAAGTFFKASTAAVTTLRIIGSSDLETW